jgi:hypothetical protein
MAKYRLLITDLTEYGDLRCVAGWDLDRGKMIRPEPHPGGFWNQSYCGSGRSFAPGNIVIFKADLPQPKTDLPHLNEDRVVQVETIAVEKTLSKNEFLDHLAKVATVGREVAFAAPVRVINAKAFVPTHTDRPSLRGLSIASVHVTFTTEKFGEKPAKPRCLISASNRLTINLSIAGCHLRDIFRKSGRDGLGRLFSGSHTLHVRLGLARGWGNFPDRCYMQVNGIYRL